MPHSLPPSVEAYLAKRPATWAITVSLLDQLAGVQDLQISAGMAGVAIGETSYPVFAIEFRETQILTFRISITDSIDIRFMTVADRTKFEALLDGDAPTRLDGSGLDKELKIKCEDLDPQTLAETLTEVASTTPMRRLVPSPDDTDTISLIKQLYAARDAYHYEAYSEEIAQALTEDNLDQVMDLVVAISPWSNEDPRNIAETKLILLFAAIHEQNKRLFSALAHLHALRPQFAAFGADAAEDVQEIDDLVALVKRSAH